MYLSYDYTCHRHPYLFISISLLSSTTFGGTLFTAFVNCRKSVISKRLLLSFRCNCHSRWWLVRCLVRFFFAITLFTAGLSVWRWPLLWQVYVSQWWMTLNDGLISLHSSLVWKSRLYVLSAFQRLLLSCLRVWAQLGHTSRPGSVMQSPLPYPCVTTWPH